MPFSHHSHSGQFCGHATNTLEEVVQDAIKKGMRTFCMTEHIPRERIDFYPGEDKVHTEASLFQLYDGFYHEARRLQKAYADRIQLFVGFEGEWIRESSLGIMERLLSKYEVDLFVGSVHHVHTFPIDHDPAIYQKARSTAGGTDEQLFCDYFDAQYEMLQAMHPPVIGHFDLIRLNSDNPNDSFMRNPKVVSKLTRNLEVIARYGGVIEFNSSALRKGMTEAYPKVEICEIFKRMGGRFTLSDDSHGVEQVGLNYHRMMDCVKRAGIEELVHLAPVDGEVVKAHDKRFPSVGWKTIRVKDIDEHQLFQTPH